ncbi:uncharacterized protein LOC117174802 isoform X2 [Belonocnema kinseyi]|uniref:uncharacterized protein LOC117174802 isoform X2 n=1 Tax=Belonocnema kinseyi TaxID=2817044 RepID=UPI00143DFA3C|nr:uncharacterized protein LOC117174802 isoform X2 [Belonocnema kinseyi]
MTFKSLQELSNKFIKTTSYSNGIERYHSGPSDGYAEHGSNWHGSKGGGKGHGTALNALTLLAFLFLLNIMQQSLQDTNTTTTTATAVILRDEEQSIVLEARKINKNIENPEIYERDWRKQNISKGKYLGRKL